ncbi:TonB-dependent receptor [Candidatus Albibeggiatoa sp. nov. NOAA]|uniref:TonB-dependent receptor plug domain-containing protein n=1 Tax=Candidatus Albibeggiatoa sp. nov. NOAA TaxID=3162724 RepID=UPI0032FC8287|nr:TonB-dependent receptor [Thiotrichaceae bacterium]
MSRLFFASLYCSFVFSYANADSHNFGRQAEYNLDQLKGLSLIELMNVPLVSIASGSKQLSSDAPAVTTVITAEDIEVMGAHDLDEILQSVAGLHVTQTPYYNSVYIMRGIYSQANPHILLLINGVPTNSFLDGNRGRHWRSMPVKSIARIEIMRGSGSALFGADAMSGVINIITKTAEDIEGTEVGTRIGSFGSKDVWALHGTEVGNVKIAAMVEYGETDGHRKIIEQDVQTLHDQIHNTTASHAPDSVNLSQRHLDARLDVQYEEWQWRLSYQGRRDIGSGAGYAQSLSPETTFREDRLLADVTYTHAISDSWDTTVQASYYYLNPLRTEDWLYIYPKGAFGGLYPDGYISRPDFREQHFRLEISNFYSGFENHLVYFGTGYHLADAFHMHQVANFGADPYTGARTLHPNTFYYYDGQQPYTAIPEKSRNNWFFFAQDTWHINENWELTSGIRYDHYSDFGGTLNPRLGLVWHTTDKLTTKLLYGRAFRSPTLNELYNTHSPTTYGNPNLDPETMESWELGLYYQVSPNLYLTATTFYFELDDLIRFRPDSREGISSSAVNSDAQRGHGGEIELNWQPSPQWHIIGNFSIQETKNKRTGQKIAQVPYYLFHLHTDWEFMHHWYVNMQLNGVMNRKRGRLDKRNQIDDYWLTDLTLHYTPTEQWRISLGVRNAFDVDAREPTSFSDRVGVPGLPNDLPLEGRHYFLELQYQL